MIKRLGAGLDFRAGSHREALAALVPLFLSILLISGLSMLSTSRTAFSGELATAFAFLGMAVPDHVAPLGHWLVPTCQASNCEETSSLGMMGGP